MELNLMALAVPLFLFFVALEYFVARRTGRGHFFSFNRSIGNLSVGVIERLADMFTAGAFYFFYDYLHKNYAVFDIKPSLLLWVALLLATDFMWYWYHRAGHSINIFWSFHVVHHTSEDFNYTAGTRITIFQAVVRTLFWSILPIIGFPAHMISIVLIVHGIYPFFTHTRLIGKLGVLEYFLVTPSHHRVHHASNPEYLDKNFGDMFIIWDKLFGTFAEERQEPTYGLTKQLNSHSFLWQHFHYLIELGYAIRDEKNLFGKARLLLGKPETLDPNLRERAETVFLSRYKVNSGTTLFRNYVLGQFIVAVAVLFVLLLFDKQLDSVVQMFVSVAVLLTIINCGAIMEQRRWVFYLEFARAAVVSIVLSYILPDPVLVAVLVAIIFGSFFSFSSLQEKYLKFIYGEE